MEKKKAAHKHEENDSTGDNVEVSPTFVHAFGATLYTWCRDIARMESRRTSVFVAGKKTPSHYSCSQRQPLNAETWSSPSDPISCPSGHQTESKVSKL